MWAFGKRKKKTCSTGSFSITIGESPVDIELVGGCLDGRKFPDVCKQKLGSKLVFRNPNPMEFKSDLGVTLQLGQVLYIRSHAKQGCIFYTFAGYLE